MIKQNKSKSDDKMLRQKAEAHLKKQPSKTSSKHESADSLKLIHELEVHQIELEMQNEELRLATEKAKLAEEKYLELFDFAPTGYLSLSKKGEILELNFSAANMLGKARAKLINSIFEFYISVETRYVYNHFFTQMLKTKTRETCEVMLARQGQMPKFVDDHRNRKYRWPAMSDHVNRYNFAQACRNGIVTCQRKGRRKRPAKISLSGQYQP